MQMSNSVRGWLIGCWVALGALAMSGALAPAPALAAGSCPNVQGGSSSVDWGVNASEQIAAGFSSNYENAYQPVLGLENVTQIRAGFKFGLAVLGDCTLRAWGTGNKGQLGSGDQLAHPHPVPVVGLSNVK